MTTTEIQTATTATATTILTTTTATREPAATTTAPPLPLTGRTVVIDPGHNGANASHPAQINATVDAGDGVRKACDTTGTAGDDGYPEHAFNLTVAQHLADELRSAGANVVMVRDDSSGWGPCITERARVGNAANADAAISIHADGNLAAGARGFHVIMPAPTSQNAAVIDAAGRLGLAVRDALDATTMPRSSYLGVDGLDTRGDLGGLNLSTVPKVFVEVGNMRNATDLALLEDDSFRRAVAAALAVGISDFLTH